jgi:hypothetical protein
MRQRGRGSDFLSPISHRCNTLVPGPGIYRFGDSRRLGLTVSTPLKETGVTKENGVRTIVVVAAALALAGCGYYHWRKDGADNAAFQRDSAECEQQAAAGKWHDCMTGKGWIYDTRI